MPPLAVPLEWELPKLRYALSFEDDHRYIDQVGPDTDFFDVKFCPFAPDGASPLFAAVSKRHVFVCRLLQTKDKDANPCEIVRIIRDDDPDALNCSCTWAKDPETGRPYLCVAGRDAKIKVYRMDEEVVATSLVGHGGEINDLATSPANPHLIASASDDTTIRLWSLHPVHRRQPCVGLLAGEGHSWNLLSVAFHGSGRYVLSAGHDQVINLWTLPDFPQEHMETPFVVHSPHFSTSEIHTGLIDCVAFCGDMVLSRACHEDVIILWCIEGFNSDNAPPSPEQAPSNHDTSRLTRSAFSASTAASVHAPQLYTRLLQLHTPGCGPQFFMRFGLFYQEGHHSTLAFCNASTKVFFWDLACFDAYREFMIAINACHTMQSRDGAPADDSAAKDGVYNPGIPRPPWLRLTAPRRRVPALNGSANPTAGSQRRLRDTGGGFGGFGGVARGGSRDTADRLAEASDRDSVFSAGLPLAATEAMATTATTAIAATRQGSYESLTPTAAAQRSGSLGGGGEVYNVETLEDWHNKYSTSSPHAQLKAHRTETVKGTPMVGRQVAWSPDGAWCVVVGSNSRVLVLQRWANGGSGSTNGTSADGADDGENER